LHPCCRSSSRSGCPRLRHNIYQAPNTSSKPNFIDFFECKNEGLTRKKDNNLVPLLQKSMKLFDVILHKTKKFGRKKRHSAPQV